MASLAFYWAWDGPNKAVLLISITGNFLIGYRLLHLARTQPCERTRAQKARWLALGVIANLCCLAYYKYGGFLVSVATGSNAPPVNEMPLGISFFTFTQIAFLVDAATSKVERCHPISYGIFVTFFPHLISGPILHHSDIIPQFDDPSTRRPRWSYIAAGLWLLTIGLVKKTVLADGIAPWANHCFAIAGRGEVPDLVTAWLGSLGYTFQIYFDFSGYSDMAVGLGLLFGIRLPLNFNSPYQSGSLIEFWRRWHMSLSAFLRDYLYIPLGGNRLGPVRRYVNLLIVMVLGGFWHGAGWTFIVWGAWHGSFLAVNHLWRDLRAPRLPVALAAPLTFLVVVCGWVFFRAQNLTVASTVFAGMLGHGQWGLWSHWGDHATLLSRQVGPLNTLALQYLPTMEVGLGWLALCATAAFLLPNSQQSLALVPRVRAWGGACAVTAAILAALGVLAITSRSEFLYFNF